MLTVQSRVVFVSTTPNWSACGVANPNATSQMTITNFIALDSFDMVWDLEEEIPLRRSTVKEVMVSTVALAAVSDSSPMMMQAIWLNGTADRLTEQQEQKIRHGQIEQIVVGGGVHRFVLRYHDTDGQVADNAGHKDEAVEDRYRQYDADRVRTVACRFGHGSGQALVRVQILRLVLLMVGMVVVLLLRLVRLVRLVQQRTVPIEDIVQ
uniref:Uncharacterized protein n=1 Tax=Anopheles merus TaxID=30066 RepID=A0A182VLA3_ANOME